jgi:hypothetical protein
MLFPERTVQVLSVCADRCNFVIEQRIANLVPGTASVAAAPANPCCHRKQALRAPLPRGAGKLGECYTAGVQSETALDKFQQK